MYKKHKYYSLDTVLGMEHLLVNLYQNYKMHGSGLNFTLGESWPVWTK